MNKRINTILKNALRIMNIRLRNNALLGPHHVSIHVSASCDDRCIFCVYHSPYSLCPPTSRPDVFKDVDPFRRLIMELEKQHVDMILLAGSGEPLMHRHIGEYLRLIEQHGMRAVVQTNGIGLRDKIGTMINLRNVGYCISLHAATPETWTSIHLGRSEKDYRDIVDYVRALPPETSRRFSLSNALCRLNYGEASKMVTLAYSLGVKEVYFQPVIYTGLEKETLERIGIYGDERRVLRRNLLEARELARKLNVRSNLDYVLLTLHGIGDPPVFAHSTHSTGSRFRLVSTPWQAGTASSSGLRRGFAFLDGNPARTKWGAGPSPPACRGEASPDETLAKDSRALYQHIACYIGYWFSLIEPNGDVLPCCGCTESLGNIGTSSFGEIWSSDRYQEFRRKTKRRKFGNLHGCRCRDCVHYRINAKIHRALHPLSGFRWFRARAGR